MKNERKVFVLVKVCCVASPHVWYFDVDCIFIKFNEIGILVVVDDALEVLVAIFVVKNPKSSSKEKE